MSKSTFDIQFETYQQLYTQHHTYRREHQGQLIGPLQCLDHNVQKELENDRRAYKEAKEAYHKEYNIVKRLFTHAASDHEAHVVQPLEHIYHRRRDFSVKVNELLVETTQEAAPIEIQTYWNGSKAVAFNPITGRTEWKQYWHGGVHGVFNPRKGIIEWQEAFNTGVYGVFNPQTNEIEWRKYFKGGVHGVYNPSIGIIEWKTAFETGVGGVYNPLTKKVEWKTSFNGGIVGYFDYETQQVKWTEKWHHGIGLIYWDKAAGTYLTTSSCGWYDVD